MKTTIDKAGRVAIPVSIRKKAGIKAGARLEVSVKDGIVQIRRTSGQPKIIRKGNRLIVVPTVPASELPKIDVAALIDEERDRWPL